MTFFLHFCSTVSVCKVYMLVIGFRIFLSVFPCDLLNIKLWRDGNEIVSVPISALLQAQHFLLYLIFWRVFIKHNTISGLDTTFSLLFRYFVQINLFKVCLASTVAISTLCCQLDSLRLYFYKIWRNFDKRLSWLDRLMFPSITMWFQSQFRCLLITQ